MAVLTFRDVSKFSGVNTAIATKITVEADVIIDFIRKTQMTTTKYFSLQVAF